MRAGADAGVDAVLALLGERGGLSFPPSRREAGARAVRRAMRAAGERDPGSYLDRLRRDAEALAALAAEATIGETYFFREPEQLDFVRERVLPERWRARGPDAPLRAWSAGCATGEEAYTLAMLARQAGLGGRLRVLGMDISPARLTLARRGRYRPWALRGVSAAVASSFFVPARGETVEVRPEVRAGVDFRPLNLASAGWPSTASGVWGMDLVLCRNVLIYLSRPVVAEVAARLLASLAEGGWLFLGAADPPLAELVPCEVVTTGAGVAYRRKDPARLSPSARPAVPALPPSAGPARRSVVAPRRETADAPPPSADADGDDEAAWIARARALAGAGERDAAAEACARGLEAHPLCAGLHHLHALLLAEAGRPAEAAASARRAVYLDPGLAAAHAVLGTAQAAAGEGEAARRALRTAESLLAGMDADASTGSGDGETAGRLLGAVRARLALLAEDA